MELGKENLNKFKASKIPLPLEPTRKFKDYRVKDTGFGANERYPLKTLNTQPNFALAGPSQQATKSEERGGLKIDTRYVTVRKPNDTLDWKYEVFRDDRKSKDNNSVIIISDDESTHETDHNQNKRPAKSSQRHCFSDSKISTTPSIKSPSLEHIRVRNIKRSLKRPHSRELLGFSPVPRERRKVEEKVKRKLTFQEPLQERLSSPDFLKRSYTTCLIRDYAPDLFTYLVSTEERSAVPEITNPMRACIINWLLKVNGPDGNPAIIQTAIWYLDNVMATGLVELTKLQLIASACYWIAHKLHGPGISAGKLVRCSNRAFTSAKLGYAEKAVLERLRFPRQPVIPQEYITYLAWCCDQFYPGEIEVAATFMCMAGLMVDKSLCHEHPSVIGAAAVKNALVLLKKSELLARLQQCTIFRVAEQKVSNLACHCSLLKRAVRILGSPSYEYKALYEYYAISPYNIAQRIISAANDHQYLKQP